MNGALARLNILAPPSLHQYFKLLNFASPVLSLVHFPFTALVDDGGLADLPAPFENDFEPPRLLLTSV